MINDLNEKIPTIFDNNIKLYRTIIFRGIHFTTVTYQTRRQKDDLCVLYKVDRTTRATFITSIIQTTSNETNCVIQIRDAPINRYLDIHLNGVQIGCAAVMLSNSNQKKFFFCSAY